MRYTIIALILIITACSSKLIRMDKEYNLIKFLQEGKDIVIEGDTISEELDLTKIIKMHKFNAKSSYGQVKGNLMFMDCTFKRKVSAFAQTNSGGEQAIQFKGNVSFVNCTFEEELNLRSCTIEGAVDFSNTTFKKGANFQDVIFMQRANFNKAFWIGEAKFQNVRFYHKTNFMDIKANNHLMFQAAVFGDETNFSMAETSKYVDFSLVRFDGPALFNFVKWGDRATFNNCLWNMSAMFVDSSFGSVSFTGSDCRGKFVMSGEKVTDKMVDPIAIGLEK